MKRILYLIPFLGFISHAAFSETYVLEQSTYGGHVTFEKVPSNQESDAKNTFDLTIDENGSYLFNKQKNDISNPNSVDNFISLGKMSGLSNAKQRCQSENLNDSTWHLINENDLKKLAALDTGINSNILSFFDSANYSFNEYWVDSDSFFKNNPERPVNVAMITTDGKLEYHNWIEEDSFSASVICASDDF